MSTRLTILETSVFPLSDRVLLSFPFDYVINSTAEVILTLRNKGEEAYKREIYGDRIIIERRINADGGGSWKIKSAEGKTISTKKEELNALTDHCNIQVSTEKWALNYDTRN